MQNLSDENNAHLKTWSHRVFIYQTHFTLLRWGVLPPDPWWWLSPRTCGFRTRIPLYFLS